MPEQGCVYFVADAHLGQGSDESNRLRERDLLAFFDRVASDHAALYVLGDLFDFWFQYGHAIPKRFVPVLTSLRALAHAGTPLHYLAPAHPFSIRKVLRPLS